MYCQWNQMSLSTTQLSLSDTATMDTPTFSNIATMDIDPLPITDDRHTAYQSTVDIECIQFQLDCHVKDLSAQWKASIPFLYSVTYVNTSFFNIPPSIPPFLYHSLTYLTIWVDRNIPRVGWVSVPQLTLRQHRMRKWLLEKTLVGVVYTPSLLLTKQEILLS